MPKKNELDQNPLWSVKGYIIKRKNEVGGPIPFFKLVHGRDPISRDESTAFNNKLSASVYPADFIGFLVKQLNLDAMTLAELFFSEANIETYQKRDTRKRGK
jgi:hypothetical protein